MSMTSWPANLWHSVLPSPRLHGRGIWVIRCESDVVVRGVGLSVFCSGIVEGVEDSEDWTIIRVHSLAFRMLENSRNASPRLTSGPGNGASSYPEGSPGQGRGSNVNFSIGRPQEKS